MERNLIKGCISTYKTRPVECILFTIFTIIRAFFYDSYDYGYLLSSTITTISIIIPIAFILNALSDKSRWIKRAYDMLLPIALVCIVIGIDDAFANIRNTTEYNSIIGILLIGVLLVNNIKNDILIIQNGISMLWAILRASISALATWILFFILVYAIESIFNTTVEAHLLGIPWTLTFPIVALYVYDNSEKISTINHPIANNLISFTMVPAIIIFLAVLYAYIAKILITWQLPSGNITITCFIYFVASIATTSIYRMSTENFFDRFFYWIPIISIPVIALYWVAIIRRIYDYGFTEARVYVVMVGVLNLVFMHSLYANKSKAYKITFIHLIGFLILLAYIPQTSAKYIAEQFQWNNVPQSENATLPSDEEEYANNDILLLNTCKRIETEPTDIIYFPEATIHNDKMVIESDEGIIAEINKETLMRKIAHQNNMSYEQLLDSARIDYMALSLNVDIDSMCVVFNTIIYTQYQQSATIKAAFKRK